jgi:hypothetical protein
MISGAKKARLSAPAIVERRGGLRRVIARRYEWLHVSHRRDKLTFIGHAARRNSGARLVPSWPDTRWS